MATKKSKAAPEPLTFEQQIQEAANRDGNLDKYAIEHLPIPAKLPNVGDEVHLGHLDDVVVVAVIDEGRRVVVQHTRASGRNNVSTGEKIMRAVPTFDVQKKGEETHDNFSKPQHYILTYSQRDVSGLMTIITSFGVDMNPEYQRDLVWEEEDKVRLIDSLFNQVDIGKFVFRKLPFTSAGAGYEIVDGKQRLSALVDFMADKFAYRGKTWSELSRTDRNYIDNYAVSYAQVGEEYTRQQILDLFVRLNTGGKPMDPAHIARVAEMAKETAPAARPSGPKR
jgi:hypothetical protein